MSRIFASRGRSHSLRYPDGWFFRLNGAELLTGSKKSTFSPCALTPEQSNWNSKIFPESSLAPERELKARDILRSLSVVMLLIPIYLQRSKQITASGVRSSIPMVLYRPCIPRTKYTASNAEFYHQRALDIAATDPIQVAHLTARAHQGVSMPTSYSTISLSGYLTYRMSFTSGLFLPRRPPSPAYPESRLNSSNFGLGATVWTCG